MKYSLDWLADPEVFAVNRIAAHSDHRIYANHLEADADNSSLIQNLNDIDNSARIIAELKKRIPYDCRDVVELFAVQLFKVLDHFLNLFRISVFRVEKLPRRDVQVFAYIEKSSHGRQCLAILYIIDVAGILSDGQAHVPCRYSLFATKLRQTQRELLFRHSISPL